MNNQQQDVVNQLENQIAELSAKLATAQEQIHHQAKLLHVNQQLNQILASTLDLTTLNVQILEIIKSSFFFSDATIFLPVDDNKAWLKYHADQRRHNRINGSEPKAVREASQSKNSVYVNIPKTNGSNGDSYLSEMALPLLSNGKFIGILHALGNKEATLSQDDIDALQRFSQPIAAAIAKTQQYRQIISERDKSNLLYEVAAELGAALDFEAITTAAVNFAPRLEATAGNIHILTDTGDVYIRSTYPERNRLDDVERQKLVRQILTEGLEAWVLEHEEPTLIIDTLEDERWLPVEHADQKVTVRCIICAPIIIERGRLQGALSFVHPTPGHFSQNDLNVLDTLATQVSVALENTVLLNDLQTNLQETQLIVDISRQLVASTSVQQVYTALVKGTMNTGADRCVLYLCDDLDSNSIPTSSEIVFVNDTRKEKRNQSEIGVRLVLAEYPILAQLVQSKLSVSIADIDTDPQLTKADRKFLKRAETTSIAFIPLVTRSRVLGLLSIEYRQFHNFTEHELTLYHTLCNQSIVAIENVRQRQQTEVALAETQTLYRAGRVLAGANNLDEILQESLIEFLYSLDLDQGGITLLSTDKLQGELVAYVQNGLVQDIETLRFGIRDNIPYQQILLSGQPFTSYDVDNDPRLTDYQNFNEEVPVKSLLEAPMIVSGETIGWIGADSVKAHRHFSQREIDLARAMADQIAITIQNRRLLETSEKQKEQLRTVAQVGRAVSEMTDLDEILFSTVDLIRDQIGYYHVSIFLIDEKREWAQVRASTGEVGKIMVERPHQLKVGGEKSIVGFVTGNAEPRIALDVGEDKVHFNNPLLPDTRSELALPMISKGEVIGALDVQSTEPNAFTPEDVETLQILADQLTVALDNARLRDETQRRLSEQATLYSIGTKIGSTLDLQDAANNLVVETAFALNLAECALSLIDGDYAQTISDYVRPDSTFESDQGDRYKIEDFVALKQVLATKEEIICYPDDLSEDRWEYEYLTEHNGSLLGLIPVLLRNQVIGVLEVYDHTSGRRLGRADINLLDSIALQAANAIQNARLFQAAQESETFMKAIIDQIPDPIFIKNQNYELTVVNQAYANNMLGKQETDLIGQTDYEFRSEEVAKQFREQDQHIFETGETLEFEAPMLNAAEENRIYFTRKIPLSLTSNVNKPDFIIGVVNDITDQKQREREREQLILDTAQNLARTQSLYRISHALATSNDLQTAFETLLGEYLNLLNLQQGSLTLFDRASNYVRAQARYIAGEPVSPKFSLAVEEDLVFQQLQKQPGPLIIDDPEGHPFIKNSHKTRGQTNVTSMLFIPIVVQGNVVGSFAADATEADHTFSQADIEMGEAIADQLSVRLESWQLLTEAQHKSTLLQAASEVSRAASSILDVNDLLVTSVNLIRDMFRLYYVGLFLVDDERRWAVLQAGTGEAGKNQIADNHRLKIGSGSMIGWSIQHRQARVDLDVGADAKNFFRNKHLPDTRSELALPLQSKREVIGALTVQSVERNAFSQEDITVLQTMADQLANAITNARLFENVAESQKQAETRLQESVAMQQFSQALASSFHVNEILEMFFQACTKVIGFEYVQFSLVEETEVRAIAGVGISEQQLALSCKPLNSQDIMADIIRTGKTEVITGWDDRFDPEQFELENHMEWVRLFTPIILRQQTIGLVETGFKNAVSIRQGQIRLLKSFIDQTVLALDNAQRFENSQRTARREAIIREVTGKIRGAKDIDSILKTTLTELSRVLGSEKGNIYLAPQPRSQKE